MNGLVEAPRHEQQLEEIVARTECEENHLFFTKYFFPFRHNLKFIENFHHEMFSDAIDDVIAGRTENLLVEVPPGSTKTEIFVINLIARGLAVNPWSRFIHLSGSDQLASLNSSTARDLVASDEYQRLWSRRIAVDSKAKKRWNIMIGNKVAGGVYSTAIGGQVTGFRAGHMAPGFQGAIIIDDPNKPEDAFSPPKLDAVNRRMLTTINNRRANPKTPIVLIMQRIAENDCAGFVEGGNVPGKWKVLKIPAVIDDAYVQRLKPKYRGLIKPIVRDEHGRFSYWEYKEPIKNLNKLERGEGINETGKLISRHVYNSQYQQSPLQLGGNVIKGAAFTRYRVLPRLDSRYQYADTAQKTKEANDYTVFGECGIGREDGRLYITNWKRGKYEAPELGATCVDFWAAGKAGNVDHMGRLRKLKVEDKVSGTGLIQTVKRPPYNIPVEGIERSTDKLTRLMDALPYIEIGAVCIPEDAPWTLDFITECEAFKKDMTHAHDDQVDVLVDMVLDLLGGADKMERWKKLAEDGE